MKANADERPTKIDPEQLYTANEIASYLRIEPDTLQVWRTTGRYPILRFRKVGGCVRYKGSDVLAYLDAPHEPAAVYVPKAPRPRLVSAKRKPGRGGSGRAIRRS